MRNRELLMRKLEHVESNMTKLSFYIKQQNSIEDFKATIDDTKEYIEQIKGFIQIEPTTGNELNKVD